MYMPSAFAVEDRALILAVLRQTPFGHLVTTVPTAATPTGLNAASPTGLNSTALPFVINDDLTTLRAHFSRGNSHWKSVDGTSALMIVPVADAYISPRWYPSKAAHGKVVPTWNYELIHLHGTLTIHDDPEWKLELVSALTDESEARVGEPGRNWAVADAPDDYIAGQLKAIVGVEFAIGHIEAKRKLSQNKPEADRLGAMGGLQNSARPTDTAVGNLMQASPPPDH